MARFRLPTDKKTISFRFNGEVFQGVEGDTLAAALLANGVHLVGRSFKYHRPRGILSAGSEEPNALVSVHKGKGRMTPNVRATVLEIYEGLETKSQNHWPSLKADIGIVNDWLGRFFPAGFYYKTFIWPKDFWTKLYEPVIRRAAGLGKSPTEPDADHYASRFAHCDVLIVGSGPAGLAAALEAAKSGKRVIVCDENAEMGGSLLWEKGATIDGVAAEIWLHKTLATLKAAANVQLLPRTTAFGYYHQNMVALNERVTDHLSHAPVDAPRERNWRIRAKQVVLAQGALEKPLVFDGNDRPGVMLTSAARTYLNRYGVKVGERIAVATTHDAAWLAAFDLARAGVGIEAIVDLRESVAAALSEEAKALNIPLFLGSSVVAAKGGSRVSGLVIETGGQQKTLACDTVLMSGGFTPSVHLFSQTQGKLRFDEASQTFLPDVTQEECQCAGAGNGVFDLSAVLAEGARAGAKAAGNTMPASFAVTGATPHEGIVIADMPASEKAPLAKAFIDYQNDVTAKDIRLAVREGMRSIEHIKRYTTTGMATDQGKTSNMNGLRVAAGALGASVPQVGLTTFRPPFTPVTFGAITGYHAGEGFDPIRYTPMQPWHAAQGAVPEQVGLWRRARYYPRAGEDMHQAVGRECRAVRGAAGLFDASTLGKIAVKGPDAAEFLNRLYVNDFKKLGVGKCRYGLLLGEDGYIRDDGVIARIAEDHFHVTTTTGGAPRVLAVMEDYLQTEWPDLKVWLTSVTEQFAVMALAGPKARAILAPLVSDCDVSAEALPHMAVVHGRICGVPMMLMRVSFSGEAGFEINVPASEGLTVWQKVMEAGTPHGLTAYGLEAMHVLRAEKGYIVVGQDTDGTMTPDDVGLNWAVSKTKGDFVGRNGLKRPDLAAKGRRQLVGLLTQDEKTVLHEGAQVLAGQKIVVPAKMIGHVTSSYYSDALGRPFAMAVIENGRALMGETVQIAANGVTYPALVTGTVFYDAKNERING